jgi:serine/threonine protein kinase
LEVLGDRYQLQEPIGRGGLATIYRGWDTQMERVVAVKVLREVYSRDPKFVSRFQNEAKLRSLLQHPNIVQVYDYGHTNGNYFIIMELVDGIDLRRYLRSRGILDADRAIMIARDVALGLGAIHSLGIVHRNVKPRNILMGHDGSIKLTDFCVAVMHDRKQYYSPEHAQGKFVGPTADVYSLGIVMYEMVIGRTTFDGDTPYTVVMQHHYDTPTPPSQFNPNIPTALEAIILHCLEKEPSMRFRDGLQLAQALEALSGEKEPPTIGS